MESGLPRWRSEDLCQLVENIPLITDLDALRATMTLDVGLVKRMQGWIGLEEELSILKRR